jgi:hypothetical protein
MSQELASPENRTIAMQWPPEAAAPPDKYLVPLYRTFLKTWPGLGVGVMIFIRASSRIRSSVPWKGQFWAAGQSLPDPIATIGIFFATRCKTDLW